MTKIIKVRVVPKAGRNEVRQFGDGYKVYLTAPPAKGKANKALLELLAGHFKVKRSQVAILKGEKTRDKLVKLT